MNKEQTLAEATRIAKLANTWDGLAKHLKNLLEDNEELFDANPEAEKQIRESMRFAEAEAMFEAKRADDILQEWNFYEHRRLNGNPTVVLKGFKL